MQAHTQNQAAAVAGPLNLWTAALRENPASQLVPLNNLRRVYPAEIKLRPLTMAMGGMVSLPVWRPQAARQFVEGRSIKDLNFSSDKEFNHKSPPPRPWFGRCNIGGEDIKCLFKSHPTPSRQKQFMNEIGLHQSHLFSLHGTCVLPIYGVWGLMESVHIVSELPHHTFWMTAHPDMPDILKKRVIEAVSRIHSRGVVHGSLDLYDILVGADARVSIVNFDFARLVDPINNPAIGIATPEEMRKEMKKVQCMIDYPTGIANRETERSTRLNNHRKSRHLNLRAGERHQDALPVSGEVDEEYLKDPPIPSEEYDVQGYPPMRFIVPGKDAQEFATALKAFEIVVGRLEQEDLLSNGLPSPAVSPQPEAGSNIAGVKVEDTEGGEINAPCHRYPTRRKRKEAPTQPAIRPTKRKRSVAPTANQATAEPPSQPLASTSRRAPPKAGKTQLSSAEQVKSSTPQLRQILKVKREPLIHESVLENNARTDRPPVIIKDFGYTFVTPAGNQTGQRMQPREQLLHHARTQRLSGVSEKAKGKRKASSDDETEEEGDIMEPRPSSRKKPRLVHTAEGINPASVRFNDAPDVYFNQHEVPRDNWWHFPKLKRPSRRLHASPRAFPALQQKLARRSSLNGPRQPAPPTRSDSLVAHTGRSPEPPSRHDSMEVHTGATPPPPSPSGSFDIDYIELDGGSFYEVRPRRRRCREVPPAPVPEPAPYPFTFTFPHGSALRAVYDWVGATLGLN